MNAMIKQALDHWHYVAPLLSKPKNEDDFNTLVEALDDLLDTFF
jgi:HTH-type transcriptional regulator/antitoxin HigA